MISCKSYIIYGSSIYFGGILGNNIASYFIELFHIRYHPTKYFYFDIYRNDLYELKYNLLGIIVGSFFGVYIGKKINNFNLIEELKITN